MPKTWNYKRVKEKNKRAIEAIQKVRMKIHQPCKMRKEKGLIPIQESI